MKGYLIETGTKVKIVYDDGKIFHLEATFPTVLPFTVITAIAVDSIRTHYADVNEFFYVDVRDLTVVDMEQPYEMWHALDDAAAKKGKI